MWILYDYCSIEYFEYKLEEQPSDVSSLVLLDLEWGTDLTGTYNQGVFVPVGLTHEFPFIVNHWNEGRKGKLVKKSHVTGHVDWEWGTKCRAPVARVNWGM